jgi:hypothetical protein
MSGVCYLPQSNFAFFWHTLLVAIVSRLSWQLRERLLHCPEQTGPNSGIELHDREIIPKGQEKDLEYGSFWMPAVTHLELATESMTFNSLR